MRILLIRSYPSYVNISNRTYNVQELGLAKALVRSGVTCDIVFWSSTKNMNKTYKFDGNMSIDIFYRVAIVMYKAIFYTHIDELIGKYDVVQSAEYDSPESMYIAVRYPRKAVIYHGPYFHPFNKRYNLYCKMIDPLFISLYRWKKTRFITKSGLAKDFLLQKGINSSNVTTIGVGVDEDDFMVDDRLEEISLVFDYLYIGRIEPRRNILFLLELIAELLKHESENGIVIIGDGDADYKEKCINKIHELGIESNVIWIKQVKQEHLAKYYKRAKFFLLPTIYEIFGMVILEAMYFGCVVVSSINGGSQMLINDNVTGVIISDFDVLSWKDRIINITSEQMDMLSINASNHIKSHFIWEKLAPLFKKCYKNVLH
ncbi:hypothetical protein AGMMS49992_18300 [Clostridia bacterium]|nr:hypothetical protein AGMMS49992_18300 [Clostridia bacterium]